MTTADQAARPSGSDTATARAPARAGSESARFKPDSPFLAEPAYTAGEFDVPVNAPGVSAASAADTPFLSEYSLPNAPTEMFETALHREIMEDIFDQEFEDALNDLVDELRTVHEEQFGALTSETGDAERFLAGHLAPLREQIEGEIDRMMQAAAALNGEALTDANIDVFLDEFAHESDMGPVFDDFFKKIFKKVKKVVKKAAKVAKKVGRVVKRISPVHIVLGKLKKIVRPLLMRVLKFALNKIPARFRPAARRLARRFVKAALGETSEELGPDEVMMLEDLPILSEAFAADPLLTGYTPAIIAAEFDALMAGYILEGEEFERDPAVTEFFAPEQFDEAGSLDDLQRAREAFVRELVELDDGGALDPAVERFVTAVLMALKVGVRLIGRKRVVSFLARQVARLIQRFVGRQAALPLSRALVDAGLKLVNLEQPDEAQEAAAEHLAQVVEETVERLAEAPQDVLEDEDLLEVYVHEAFEGAVASNFPPKLIRPDLRRASPSGGAWALQPPGRKPKRYKKYTRTLKVTLTRQMAEGITTFGNQNLRSFLKEQLGLPIDRQPVQATVHLYEAIRGTWLSRISRLETDVPGLGSSRRKAWMQIHPLTCEAAAILIPADAGLCKKVAARHLVSRHRIAVGQRFYFLEIPDAHVITVPEPGGRKPENAPPARASEVNVTLDFALKRIGIFNFLSEAAAMEIATHLRERKPVPALIGLMRRSLEASLRTLLSGSPTRHLRLKREVPAEEGFLPAVVGVLKFVGEVLAGMLIEFIVKQLIKSIKANYEAFAREFIAAADDPADGVTVIFWLSQVDEVMTVLTGGVIARGRALATLYRKGVAGVLVVKIRAGFHRE